MRDSTLIVSATYDDSYPEWYDELPEPKVRVSTAGGGYADRAFIDTYRYHWPKYDSFLFLQDSLEPQRNDPVTPFREMAEGGAEVVAWGFFPLFFDNPTQELKVAQRYPGPRPPYGIFGPIFWASRKALDRVAKLNLLPTPPRDKMEAQGTERAWAMAFYTAGVPMTALSQCINDGESPILFPEDKTFNKHFAGRV